MAEYIEANTRRLLACWVDTTQHKALGHMVTTISQPASQSGEMALVARAPHTTPLLLNECVWLGEGSEAEASTIDGRVCGMRMAQQPNTKHTSKTIISTTLFFFTSPRPTVSHVEAQSAHASVYCGWKNDYWADEAQFMCDVVHACKAICHRLALPSMLCTQQTVGRLLYIFWIVPFRVCDGMA